MAVQLEVACFSLASVMTSVQGGADRLEFCANASVGGTTPSAVDWRKARALAPNTPMVAMIRPRGGNFVYSAEEVDVMLADIDLLLSLGADGFVFGALTEDGLLDEQTNQRLLGKASGKPCTLHRAIDHTADILEAASRAEALGFASTLTSGGASAAQEGMDTLAQLVANTTSLTVMPGGGIRSDHIQSLHEHVGATWYHTSALTQGQVASAEEIMAIRRRLR